MKVFRKTSHRRQNLCLDCRDRFLAGYFCIHCEEFYTSKEMNAWVGCDTCENWCHKSCATAHGDLKEGVILERTTFHCLSCKNPRERALWLRDPEDAQPLEESYHDEAGDRPLRKSRIAAQDAALAHRLQARELQRKGRQSADAAAAVHVAKPASTRPYEKKPRAQTAANPQRQKRQYTRHIDTDLAKFKSAVSKSHVVIALPEKGSGGEAATLQLKSPRLMCAGTTKMILLQEHIAFHVWPCADKGDVVIKCRGLPLTPRLTIAEVSRLLWKSESDIILRYSLSGPTQKSGSDGESAQRKRDMSAGDDRPSKRSCRDPPPHHSSPEYVLSSSESDNGD